MMLEPLGEVGANFSLQLSSRTQFTKINNKKVIAENQCEKHKKSSLKRVHRVLKTYRVCGWSSIKKKRCIEDSMIRFQLHHKCLSLPFSFVVINMYCLTFNYTKRMIDKQEKVKYFCKIKHVA